MDRQIKGILGAKLGMTQVWDNNKVVPVTVVQAGPCVVTQVRTPDKDGYPAIKPPWGSLSAIDLNTGEYRWRIPLGERPELKARGIPTTGSEQYGGPIVTAGGLVFIGATMDGKFRAFDKDTGALLWEYQLPLPAYASPSTYRVNGKQYVVISSAGGKLGSQAGDSYIAFSLP